MAYPIDLIRDQEREMLRRQTMGMVPGAAQQRASMVQDARTGQALSNMFATQQRMALAEDARLQQQAVMEQRQQQQQEMLQARALEAQQGREFRSLEAEKVRAAQMERLKSGQQFQRSMQRRRLGSGRKAAKLEKDMQRLFTLGTDTERAPGSSVRNQKLAAGLAKKILRQAPDRREEVEAILEAIKSPVGIAYRTTAAGQRGMVSGQQRVDASRLSLLGKMWTEKVRGSRDTDLPPAQRRRFESEAVLIERQMQDALKAQEAPLGTALAAQAAPPQTSPSPPLQPGQSKPVPVGVRNSFTANEEFEVPGVVGVFIHDGQTLRRER